MTGKTHIAIGIASALTLSRDLPIEEQLLVVAASILGSLAPDLDHPRAKLNQKLLKFNNNLFRMIFYLSFGALFLFLYSKNNTIIFLLLGFACILVGISGHRGFTHSIIGFLGANLIVKIIASNYNIESLHIGFSIGYAMHLIADFFNPRGIKLFYPSDINVSSPITIKTGSNSEKLLFMFASIYSIFALLDFIKI